LSGPGEANHLPLTFLIPFFPLSFSPSGFRRSAPKWVYNGCTIPLDSAGPCMISERTMGVLSQEQLDLVWNEHGLKHKMARFYKYLRERGLLPLSVPRDSFLRHMKHDILDAFLVKGVQEDKDGRRLFADGDGENSGS